MRSAYRYFHDFDESDFDTRPKRDTRPYDQRRQEARELADVMDAGIGRDLWVERATWTDEQWQDDDARIERAISEAEAKKAERERLHHRSGLLSMGWPRRAIEEAETADLEKPAIKKVIEWDSSSRNMLVLSGPAGCGKTVAAAYDALRRRNISTVFLRASTFARASRYDEERDDWLSCPALCLDDLGAEYADAKGSFLTDLDEIVDSFYGSRRVLIITTNLPSKDFKARYGERITDRLRECGVWFEIRGASLRAKGRG